jgi:hypothetical protein
VEVIKNLPQAEYNGERSTNPGIAWPRKSTGW